MRTGNTRFMKQVVAVLMSSTSSHNTCAPLLACLGDGGRNNSTPRMHQTADGVPTPHVGGSAAPQLEPPQLDRLALGRPAEPSGTPAETT